MISAFSSMLKTSTAKKQINSIDKIHLQFTEMISSYLTEACSSSPLKPSKRKVGKIETTLSTIYTMYFHRDNFSEDLFELIISKCFIQELADAVSHNKLELNKVIIPYISKILFENERNLLSINYSIELLLMNTQVVSCIHIIINTFINNVQSFQDNIRFIENIIIPFLRNLINVFICYPNVHYAVSSTANDNTMSNEYHYHRSFDTNMFDLIIQLFNNEHTITSSSNKSAVRTLLFKCINFDNFHSVGPNLMENLLVILVSNLVSYYKKYISSSSTAESLSLNEGDTVSYLKFLDALTYSFPKNELKTYLSNILFNNFLCEHIQTDIIALTFNINFDTKITYILRFIHLLTLHITSAELNEMLFYFLFGFNYYNISTDEDYSENVILSNIITNITSNNNSEGSPTKRHLRLNSNIATYSSTVNLNINKANHNFESIIAFFSLVLESNDSYHKYFLLQSLTNLLRNIPYIFMSELLVPYYLFKINEQHPTTFNAICEKLKRKTPSKTKTILIETLKQLHPSSFPVHTDTWLNNFLYSIDSSYNKNISLLNKLHISDNDTDDVNHTTNISANESSLNLNMSNVITLNNISLMHSEFNYPLCNNASDVEFAPNENSHFGSLISNYNVKLRASFFDKVVKGFERFKDNKYIDNLNYARLFVEVCGIPVVGNTEGETLWNVYNNVTYAYEQGDVFSIGMVGVMYKIKEELEEKVRMSFTKEEVDKEVALRRNELKKEKTERKREMDFIDNLILYGEVFKDVICNLFIKAYIAQHNVCSIKKMKGGSIESIHRV